MILLEFLNHLVLFLYLFILYLNSLLQSLFIVGHLLTQTLLHLLLQLLILLPLLPNLLLQPLNIRSPLINNILVDWPDFLFFFGKGLGRFEKETNFVLFLAEQGAGSLFHEVYFVYEEILILYRNLGCLLHLLQLLLPPSKLQIDILVERFLRTLLSFEVVYFFLKLWIVAWVFLDYGLGVRHVLWELVLASINLPLVIGLHLLHLLVNLLKVLPPLNTLHLKPVLPLLGRHPGCHTFARLTCRDTVAMPMLRSQGSTFRGIHYE